MHRRPIPGTNHSVPVIGMGTWQTFDVGSSRAARAPLREVLELFFDAGGRVVDSSPMYGRSEQVLGDLLAPYRKRAFYATKVWTRGKAAGTRQIEASFRKLHTDRIDLLQIHNLLDWKAHLPTLRALKREGRIRYLGITHYRLGAFDDMERIIRAGDIDFVQLPYSIRVREAERRLLPCAADQGTAVLVMRPFEGGDLFRAVKGKPLPKWVRELDIGSWAQLFLKFILAHPAVTCPIPATADPAHMRDNLHAGFGTMPSRAHQDRLARLVQG